MTIPKFICFDEAGLDEFFIFKHRYEREVLDIDEHIPYTEFMSQMIDKIKDNSYYNGHTKSSIGFCEILIGDDIYIIFTPSDKDTTKAFLNIMKDIKYDYKNLDNIDMMKLPEDLNSMSFFNISGKMKLIS